MSRFFGGARPTTALDPRTESATLVISTYHAWFLQANRRFTDGLQFMTSYTLAKAEDVNQGSVTFTQDISPFNVFDLKLDKGRSNLDRRHKFVASAVYAPRVKDFSGRAVNAVLDGWTLSPILQVYTGQPYDARTSGSLGAIGTNPGGTAGGVNGSERPFPLPVDGTECLYRSDDLEPGFPSFPAFLGSGEDEHRVPGRGVQHPEPDAVHRHQQQHVYVERFESELQHGLWDDQRSRRHPVPGAPDSTRPPFLVLTSTAEARRTQRSTLRPLRLCGRFSFLFAPPPSPPKSFTVLKLLW